VRELQPNIKWHFFPGHRVAYVLSVPNSTDCVGYRILECVTWVLLGTDIDKSINVPPYCYRALGPELISVTGSQPVGNFLSHCGRLPLLSAGPAVTFPA